MLNTYDKARANKELKQILNNYRSAYKKINDKNWNEYRDTLRPGQVIQSKIDLSLDNLEMLKKEADTCREKAQGVLQPLLDKIDKEISTAPSAEATNTIQLLALRSSITEADIDNLMKRYGDNVQAYKAIRDIAKEKDIAIYRPHPAEVERDNINHLLYNFEKNPEGYGDGKDGITYLSFIESTIDRSLPAETE